MATWRLLPNAAAARLRPDAMDMPTTAPAESQTPRLRHLKDLPGPRGVPVLGNLLQIDTPRMHQQLEAWCAEFGPCYKLKLGRGHVLVIGDHAATAAVLRDRPDGFRRTARMEAIGSEMGLLPGVFGVNGEAWKRQRRMVMAAFDPAHVRRYHPALVTVAQRLTARWQRAAQQGVAIDLQADLMRYTVDAIAGLAFGAEVSTLDSDGDIIQQHLDKIFPALFHRMMSPLPTWRWLRTPAVRQLETSMVAVNTAVQGFIAAARARLQADPALRSAPHNLLEAMLVAADAPGSGIDDTQVAGNVLTMLLAGEDTTANTLAWMIDLLWRHPASLARAVDEVRQGVADPAHPTLEELAQLDFVEACAHETMRLKPVAPIIGLQALRDTVVGDVRLPAGGVVINVMRRDSVSDQHLPRAASFEPGRWLADGTPGAAASVASAAKRVSMPFGAGPRICPGRYLALLEMKMAMVALLGHFDIDSVGTPDGQPAAEKLSFTMMPVGLALRLRERALAA
jgi:cytochrome P450